jgi:uncharacterized protein involved in type VI secretion and phage assembly
VNLLDLLKEGDEEQAKARRVIGAVTGIVANNKDPQGLGRVRVEFPWRTEASESDWVKVASFMAGSERGGFFLPDVGDEVLVVFEHGDVDHPYVVGALWSGQDKPPETNQDGENNIKKIRSRSGHEIIFDDNSKQRQEKLEIHTNAGHRITLDDSAGQEKIEVVDKTGGNKLIIDSVQNSLSIESTMNLKIKAAVVEIEATGSLTLKSNAVLTVQGLPVKIN